MGPARDLPQRLLREPPPALRRGRLRLPGGGPDGRQRHQRQDPAAAGRRRAVRHALRAGAGPRAGAGHARRRPASTGEVGVAGTAHHHRVVDPHGVAHAAGHGRHRVRGRGAALLGAHRDPVGAGDQRGGPAHQRRSPGGRRPRTSPARHRARRQGPVRLPDPPDRAFGAGHGRHDGPPRRGLRPHRGAGRGPRGPRPGHVHHQPRAPREAARRQAGQLRVVGRAVRARPARSGVRGHRRRMAHRLGGHAARAAGLPRRVLEVRRRPDRRGPRAPARHPLRPVSSPPGRGPSRDPGPAGQGADRSGLRRACLLGHRELRAAGAHLHLARLGAGRVDLAPLHPAGGARPAPPSSGSRGRRSRGGPSPARSARRTGRRGRRRSTSMPTSRTR